MKGRDPILLEDVDITEWISKTDDNFVLVLPNKKRLCLKKSYFLNPQINDLYLNCSLKKGNLMVQETNKSKLYRNIGYYFDKYTMIDDKELIKYLKQKKNMYELKTIDKDDGLAPIDEWDTPEPEFINQETLLLSQIGLFKVKKGTLHVIKKMNLELFKQNMPHKEEVYFNALMSLALFNYSFQWDAPINRFLRIGDDYFNSDLFKQFRSRYGPNQAQAVQNVKNKIEAIDKCFMEVAPRNENKTKVYYRGMTQGYGFVKDGDGLGDVIVRNFTSVSETMDIALRFFNKVTRCCVHELTIDKGIPYINMVTTTKFKHEKEILIPRDLRFTLTGFRDYQYAGKNISIRQIRVSMMRPNQFKLDSGCSKYPVVNIVPLKKLEPSPVPIPVPKPKVKVLQMVPNNVEANLKPAKPAKKPKCPKGSRRNKKSGLCLDKDGNAIQNQPVGSKEDKPEVPNNIKTKKKRCPNGQRRNKKSGLCEPK